MTHTEEIEADTKKKKLQRRLLLIAKIAVSFSLLLFLATKLDFTSLSKLKPDIAWHFLVSTLVMLLALAFMTVRWRYVLDLIERKSYSYALLYRFYLVGSFFNIFIPGAIGGDAIRLYYLSKAYHITKTRSLLSVFIERVAGLFILGIILLFALLFNDTIRTKLQFGFGSILLAAIVIVAALVFAKYFLNKKIVIGYKEIAVILLLSGLGQFGDILIALLFSDYFGLNITLLNLMAIMPLVYIATVVPISLGGVGVREGVMTAGMTLYGVSVPDAVMVSFLLYLVKIIVGTMGWFAYLRLGKVGHD